MTLIQSLLMSVLLIVKKTQNLWHISMNLSQLPIKASSYKPFVDIFFSALNLFN